MRNGIRLTLSMMLCVLSIIAPLSSSAIAAPYLDQAASVAVQNEPEEEAAYPTFEFEEGNVAIEWVPELKATAWKVYRSENNVDYLLLHDSFIEEPDYIDQTARAGKVYYYVVEGFDDEEQLLYYTPPMKAIIKAAQPLPASEVNMTITLTIGSKSAKVNGKAISLSTPPTVIGNTTMVPLRFVAEALEADIQWDGKERKITILMNGNRIELWLDKEIAKVNESPVALTVPAKRINGSTLVPVRFVSQNLKLKVAFNNHARTLTISGAGASTAPSSPAEADKLIALLKSDQTNSGRSLQKGHVYGDQLHISFQDYNEQTGEFGGKLEWMGTGEIDTLTGKADGNKLVMRQVSRHNSLYESTKEIDGLITVSVTDTNHLSGTWSIPGSSLSGTIRFTINPDDVTAFFHAYQVFVPSSSAALETEEQYETLTSVGALNGGLLIKSDGTYEWNSSVDGKVIKGKWVKTGDVDWPLKLLKGESGHDWSVAEAIHETGASIYLWDGTTTQNARLVKK